MITLRQVEAFKTVMERGTMLRAAEQMGLSQPAVSRLIGDLERGIGYPLFDRRKGRIVPRRQASELYDEVDRAFVGLRNIANAAQRISRGNNGQLRIAVLPVFGLDTLASVVAKLAAEDPDVEIASEGRLRAQVIKDVAEGRCDIGFVTGPVERPDLVAQVIAYQPCPCMVPTNHPLAGREFITPEDLRDVELITPCNAGPFWESTFRMLRSAGVEIAGRMSVSSAEMACALVAQGFGVTFSPRSALGDPPSRIRFVPFRPKLLMEIVALYPVGRPPSGLAARFIQAYTQTLQD